MRWGIVELGDEGVGSLIGMSAQQLFRVINKGNYRSTHRARANRDELQDNAIPTQTMQRSLGYVLLNDASIGVYVQHLLAWSVADKVDRLYAS
eukprot:5455316-Pyramimonas_sp.AAC.1